jgi:hypothetical protein
MVCQHQDFDGADPVVRELGIGAAALRYQGQGYAVLPLARGRKRPHRMLGDSGGVHWASKDGKAARWCWSQDKAANLGVACGSPSRLVVLDLDVKHGHNGPATLWGFMRSNGLGLPGDAVVHTPSGGVHLWLRTGRDVRVPARPGILPGVDILGDGNLVVAPPSAALVASRNGEQVPVPYRWDSGCFCFAPDAPPWVLQWVASAGPAPGSGGGGTGPDEDVDIEELKTRGAQVGSRNREMYRAACALHRKMSPDDVLEELMVIWLAGDQMGMPWSEVKTINESARKFIDRQKQKERAARDAWLRGHSGH